MVNITCKFDKKKVVTSVSSGAESSLVFLTDEWGSSTDRFVQCNDLVPCLRPHAGLRAAGETEAVFLGSPESVMDLAVDINKNANLGGYLANDISNLLQSLRNCSRDIISS